MWEGPWVMHGVRRHVAHVLLGEGRTLHLGLGVVVRVVGGGVLRLHLHRGLLLRWLLGGLLLGGLAHRLPPRGHLGRGSGRELAGLADTPSLGQDGLPVDQLLMVPLNEGIFEHDLLTKLYNVLQKEWMETHFLMQVKIHEQKKNL